MLPAETTRGWHLDQLRRSIDLLAYVVQTASPEDRTRYRDGDDGWTVMEVLGHLYDFEKVFQERIRVTLETENGELPFPDPLRLIEEGQFNDRDADELLAAWQTERQQTLTQFATCQEADWDRTAKHPTRGLMSLTDIMRLLAWHDVNHLEQIAHILQHKHQPAPSA